MILIIIAFSLVWGSFLNVLAVRLISGKSLLDSSACPHCAKPIQWYDNIPVFSWFLLWGKCRFCTSPISVLYPLIELLTCFLFVALWMFIPTPERYSYAIFFSALIVTIRSDLETMFISRFTSLYLVPFAWIAIYFHLLPLSLLESISASILIPLFVWCLGFLFQRQTGKVGIGQGDIDLMALIGATLGFFGAWISLCIGSFLGCIIGISYLLISGKDRNTRFPFGPFLVTGAIIFVFAKPYLFYFLAYGR